ncbi:hypothetical protein ACKKBF_B21185 [Auxenochlorella protothecoides x Auxenochlorella symbiontica]
MGIDCNLRDQLTFYGSFHANKWNQLIHFVFVPVIFWSFLVWLAYTPELIAYDVYKHLPSGTPAWALTVARYLSFNGAFVITALYGIYYTVLDAFAGLSWSLCVGLPAWAGAVAFRSRVPNAWAWAILIHVLSWVMQILPGHIWAEKRRPALLTSFFQSVVLAPLFVWYELLFLLGYRPQLYADINARIQRNVAEYRAAQRPLLASGQ